MVTEIPEQALHLTIQISDDQESWTDVYHADAASLNQVLRTVEVEVDNLTARYIRLLTEPASIDAESCHIQVFTAAAAQALMIEHVDLYGGTAQPIQASRENFHLYLFIGQSNMSSRAGIEEEDRFAIARAYVLNGRSEWEKAENGWVSNLPAIASIQGLNRYSTVEVITKINGYSLASMFAQTMTEHNPDIEIGIVSNARGGTKLAEWQKGAGTGLYEEAVRRTQDAMKSGTLKGILWHQGEADQGSPETYMENLRKLVDCLRRDLHAAEAPFIVGQLLPSKSAAFNRMLMKVVEHIPYSGWVSNEGTESTGDGTHLNNASQKLLGKRYANSIRKHYDHYVHVPFAAPLAQHFSWIYHNPDTERYVEGCGLVRLDDGSLLAAVPVVPRQRWSQERRVETSRTYMMGSTDGGASWNELAELPYYSAVPWTYDGILYLFAVRGGMKYRNDDLLLLRSEDGGVTWSEPSILFSGHYWNCHTGMAIRNNRLYWAIDDLGLTEAGYNSPLDIPRGARRAPRVVSGDLTRDLMDPASWRMSNPVPFPEETKLLVNERFEAPHNHYLEPNVIDVNGHLRVLVTVKLCKQSTANICAVLDVSDDGANLEASFTQYAFMPGGQLKFCVIWDPISRLFWATSNMAVDSQKLLDWDLSTDKDDPIYAQIPGGDDRRNLMLSYSADGLNWFQAGCVAQASSLTNSFMYAKPVIDGDDLVIISRTSIEAPNRHDANYATFHRVSHFRKLALNLYMQGGRS
nr:sialate O-acetylesterase [Paenibacillus koleovorans]